tara:strand:+ start:269 stop:424 length:156 start_codon:yes stop_codon:yes gene_type:complete
MIASKIVQAKLPGDIVVVETLFQECAKSLSFNFCFLDFDNEIGSFLGAQGL